MLVMVLIGVTSHCYSSVLFSGKCNGDTGMFLRDLTEPFDSGGGTLPYVSSDNTYYGNSSQTPTSSNNNTLHTPTEHHDITSQQSKQSQSSSHISSTVNSSKENPTQISSTHNDIDAHPGSNLSGTVLYDFQAESASELSLKEGQIVTNIQVVDEDWWSGTLNGANGMFPKVFIEILDSSSIQSGDNSLQTPPQSSFPTATVLYNFTAVNAEEISLTEGQVVTVISESVDDWTKVRTRTGEEGLCPSDFLDPPPVSSSEPEPAAPVVKSAPLTNGVTMRKKTAAGE